MYKKNLEVIMMKKLLDFGNRYAKQSTWKDFALVKFCLFSMGLAAGTRVADRHKKAVSAGSLCVFAAAYIPLIIKMIRVACRETDC